MFDQLSDFLDRQFSEKKKRKRVFPKNDTRLLTAITLVHLILVDGDIDEGERRVLHQVLAKQFKLNADVVADLVTDAIKQEQKAEGFFQICRQLKQNLKQNELVDVVYLLWQIVYADGIENPYETKTVERFAMMLGVEKELSEAVKGEAKRLSESG